MSSLVKDPLGRSPYWYCAFTNADGIRTKRSTKETDEDQARAICDAWERASKMARNKTASAAKFRQIISDTLQKATGQKLDDPTVSEWFNRWIGNIKGTVADSSMTRYSGIVRDFLEAIGPLAQRRLEEVTDEDLTRFRNEMQTRGLAPRTINYMIKRIVKPAFRTAVEVGIIARNPCATVRAVRDAGPHQKKGTFTPEQVARLVDAAQGDWKGLILAGYYTGARLRDLSQLRWANVDLPQKMITFVQQKLAGKSQKASVRIPMHPGLRDYLLSRPSSDWDQAPVFPELYAIPGAGKRGLSVAFKKLMAKARIDPGLIRERSGDGRSVSALSFHSLRHTFNSTLANAEVPQEVRMKFTGHASADMNTLYTALELKTLDDAIQKIQTLPL
jgi:integrase